MLKHFAVFVLSFMIILSFAGCSEPRMDPCKLLSVEDVESVDGTVSISLWAGRDGERKDDEVCMFYTDDGDPRVMLFVWYDKEKDPMELVKRGVEDTGVTIVDLPGIGSKATASFKGNELKLLAVKSTQGVVGLRVRNSVRKDSADFQDIVQLAEKALARK